jgi:hypothetical protein
MFSLTLDLPTSACLLGTEPESLLQFIHREQVSGVLFFADQPKISIFTLANLLNTTPEQLLDLLEDEAIAALIEEVDDDEWFDAENGKAFYQSLIAKTAEEL